MNESVALRWRPGRRDSSRYTWTRPSFPYFEPTLKMRERPGLIGMIRGSCFAQHLFSPEFGEPTRRFVAFVAVVNPQNVR